MFDRGTHLGECRGSEPFGLVEPFFTRSWAWASAAIGIIGDCEIAQTTRTSWPKRKARQHQLTSLFWFEPGFNSGISGGGGDRTPVPRWIRNSFYVRSRVFGFSPAIALLDKLDRQLARNKFNNCRARRGQLRSGIDDRFSGLSGKIPQPGLRFLTRPIPNYLRHLNCCGQLLTRSTDQPRYATKASNNPVESNSPPCSLLHNSS